MHPLPLISTIAAAFTAACVLGIIARQFKLSPILGYLLAGIVIGPYTPGFIGDVHLAHQLAEIGVILLMFGVGLHFHLKDLLAVRNIAIPGALAQIVLATTMAISIAHLFHLPFSYGLILGIAMSVASTVVLIRGLTDNHLLHSLHGHVAIGWLIIEDIFTVLILVLIPAISSYLSFFSAPASALPPPSLPTILLTALAKLLLTSLLILWGGAKIIPWIMLRITRLQSRELFTLTILVLAIAVAAGSSSLFGTSMALGAFLAGMAVGQSPISQQAAADALPFRDAFAVLFFTSVGMIFDPLFILHQPLLTLACLAIVIIGKPLIALLIIALIGYPVRTALTVAIGLAQIGEFSFILSDLARKYHLLDDSGHHILVTCALISIALNPILFRSLPRYELFLKKHPSLWKLLNYREQRRIQKINFQSNKILSQSSQPVIVILGYSIVGQTIDRLLQKRNINTVIVDLNLDTIQSLTRQKRQAIYGDALNIEIIAQTLTNATHLIITIPHAENRNHLITAAKLINPYLKILTWTRHISDHQELIQAGCDYVGYEQTESTISLTQLLLTDLGESSQTIQQEIFQIRQNHPLSTSSATNAQ